MKQLLYACSILAVFTACSGWDMVRVAKVVATGDVSGVQQMATDKAIGYAVDPKSAERDIKQFLTLLEKFRRAVGTVWGPGEVKEPKPKEYVKYTQNYLSRASVDFDRGIVTVETLDQDDPLKSLKTATVTTLLTPNDPRAVDLYSAGPIELGDTPFLLGEVKDHENKDIRWSWRAERFADHLIGHNLEKRTVGTGSETKNVHYLKMTMVKDHGNIRVGKYKPIVDRNADRFSISKNLIFAIMKTESDFNPYAVSHAPAFGLMQIVPTTAGRDVYAFLNKKSGTPSKTFLFTPENNIQYGTAYLHLLQYKYLDEIKDPVSREYCSIAAYNTGAGNVLRTFHDDRKRAPSKINALAPLQVYETLRTKLSSDEARRYLAKVIDAKKRFVNF
jgi:peptidoglycan lytic transglycosylase C